MTRILQMINDTQAKLKGEGKEAWLGGFQLSRCRHGKLTDGSEADCYCFEYNVWPGSQEGATETERLAAVRQLESYACFLQLNEQRRIIKYIDTVRVS
jgi:hypothetical protein